MAEIEDDEGEEEGNEPVVLRTQLAFEFADAYQPTQEEIKEYNSFSSKLPHKTFSSQ